MIYSITGSQLSQAFDVEGNDLSTAYDVLGEIVFTKTLKVMSFNVGSWYGYADKVPAEQASYYHSMYDGIFEREDCDLIGIQEYYSMIGSYNMNTDMVQFFPYFYYVDRQSNPSKAGRAIGSKYQLSNTAEINFQAQQGEVRSFLTGTFQFGGKEIYLLTAHLALNRETLLAQIQELLDYLENKEYWILTGDFNINFDGAESQGYADLIEPFLNKGYHSANGTDFGFIKTFVLQDGTSWRCLDNIFTSGNITITDAYRDETKLYATLPNGIDHLPLIATLTI